MAVGAVLAAAILLAMHRDQTYLILGALGLAAVVGVPTLPAVFVRLCAGSTYRNQPLLLQALTPELVALGARLVHDCRRMGSCRREFVGDGAGYRS